MKVIYLVIIKKFVIKKFKIVLIKKKIFVINVKNIIKLLEQYVLYRFQTVNLNNLLMDVLNVIKECTCIIKNVIMIFKIV